MSGCCTCGGWGRSKSCTPRPFEPYWFTAKYGETQAAFRATEFEQVIAEGAGEIPMRRARRSASSPETHRHGVFNRMGRSQVGRCASNVRQRAEQEVEQIEHMGSDVEKQAAAGLGGVEPPGGPVSRWSVSPSGSARPSRDRACRRRAVRGRAQTAAGTAGNRRQTASGRPGQMPSPFDRIRAYAGPSVFPRRPVCPRQPPPARSARGSRAEWPRKPRQPPDRG